MTTPAAVSSKPSRSSLRLALLPLAISTAFALPAWAEDAELATVQVSADGVAAGYASPSANPGGKGETALKDIPQPLSVVTRERIEDQNMVRLDDLARRTTGMVVLANDQGRSSIVVRGFELDAYLVDGLPAPLSSIYGSQPDLALYDHVEVLRGPAGLYNGSGEPGGTVNLARKRAQKDFALSGSQAVGSWNARRTELDVGGALNADGSLRARGVAAYQQKDSWVDVNDNQNAALYGTLEFDMSPATTVSLALSGAKSKVTPFNGLPTSSTGQLLDLDRSTFIGADWNRFKNRANEVFAELEHRLDGGAEFKASARYVDRAVDFKYAYAGSAVNASTGNVSRTAIARDYDESALAADAHLSLPFSLWGRSQQLVAGVDYRRYDQTTLQGSASVSGSTNVYQPTSDWPEPTITLSSRTNVQPEQYGAYANLRLRVLDPLSVIGGARVSWYDSVTTNLVSSAQSEVKLDGEFTPYAGLVYELGGNWSAFASYTGIFQPQTSLGADGQPLDPREGRNLEAGLKGEHLGGRFSSQFSLFQLRDRNRAVAVPSTSYYAASGEVEVQGAEAELSGQIMPGWEVSAGYAYTHTEYLAGSSGQAGTVFSTYTPRHNANLWTRYDFREGRLQGAYLGGGVRAMSDFYTVSGNYRISQGGYAVVDALAGYRFSPRLDVSLSLNNLFDRSYYQRVGGTSVFNFYGEPRSAWLKAAFKY